MNTVAVLYARKNSIYKSLPGVSVFDINRDARTFDDSLPVVAHPPCRLFGKLKQFSKAPQSEKLLAYDAVQRVKKCGGVLEHPAFSLLWKEMSLPLPGVIDEFGGFTLPILQSWFGHRLAKATWLYINGVSPGDLPPLPYKLGVPAEKFGTGSMLVREGTPIELANWLITVAKACKK